jgi:hypothetical protein
MPSSVPFDHPSLVLGNIVDPALLGMLKDIGTAQDKIDGAQDKMNSLIAMKRGLAMTINELSGMNVDVSGITDKLTDVDKKLVDSAKNYINVRLENEDAIQATKAKISAVTTEESLESPIDYERTKIKKMPLAADSLKLDAQYFSYGSNEENSPGDKVANIEDYVKETTASLGTKASGDMAKAVGSQIRIQQKKHSLAGTLIITANCTHKNASLLSPLVLDIDKSIDIWNRLHKQAPINTKDVEGIKKLSEDTNPNPDSTITILSGATYGSSFVGMVHVLNSDTASSNTPSMIDIAAGLQERLTIGGWIEDATGGFGVDTTVVNDVKQLLSTQRITSHISLVVMGVIPSIKSNQISMGVKTLGEMDSSNLSDSLSVIENSSNSEIKTVNSSSESAKKGKKLMDIKSNTIKTVIQSLGTIDHKSNQVMDINSLMIAFEDYLQEIKKGNAGVPINFYLKTITQSNLVDLWVEKYYPKNAPTPTDNVS